VQRQVSDPGWQCAVPCSSLWAVKSTRTVLTFQQQNQDMKTVFHCSVLTVFLSLCLLVLVLTSAAHCQPEQGSFGEIDVTSVYTENAYVPAAIKVQSKNSIYKSFLALSSTNGTLGSIPVDYGMIVFAKYDPQLHDYVWATAIDNGGTFYAPTRMLPACDKESLFVMIPNCAGGIPQFNITTPTERYSLLLKYDKFGKTEWFKVIPMNRALGDPEYLSAYAHLSCEQDNKDAIYFSGTFRNEIHFGATTLSSNSTELNTFVAKFDENGENVWASTARGVSVVAIVSDEECLYLTGTLKETTILGNSTLVPISTGDILLTRINKESGQFLDASSYGYAMSGFPTDIALGTDNSVIVSGHFSLNTTLGNFTLQATAQSMFLMQVDRISGQVAWAKSIFSNPNVTSSVSDIDIGLDGSIYMTGTCHGNATVRNVTVCHEGTLNLFVTKLTPLGDVSYFLNVAGQSDDSATVSVGDDGSTYAYGYIARADAKATGGRVIASTASPGRGELYVVAEVLDHPAQFCNGTNAYEPSVCSGHGRCNTTCSCSPGYLGDTCQKWGCYGLLPSSSVACSGTSRGTCTGPNKCTCNAAYSGTQCELLPVTISYQTNMPSPKYPAAKTWFLNATATPVRPFEKVDYYWQLYVNGTNPASMVLETPTILINLTQAKTFQFNVTDIYPGTSYMVKFSVVLKTYGHGIGAQISNFPKKVAMGDILVNLIRGAMLYDTFEFSTPQDNAISNYTCGYLNSKGERVYLGSSLNWSTCNTKFSVLGTVTLFVQAVSVYNDILESRQNITVYLGDAQQTTDALTDKANNLNQLNGTQLEEQLKQYTVELKTSLPTINQNQTSDLLNNLVNIIESKQSELSTDAQMEAAKTISEHYDILSENSTIKTADILTNIIQSNSTNIDDMISIAHDLANVMISSNSSQVQKEAFNSVVTVLTEKVRQNMTEGETKEISFPNLETVIVKLNQTSAGASQNTTIVVKQPSTGATNNNTDYIVIDVDNKQLSNANATYVQGLVTLNPPGQYPNKCNTNQVSSVISTMLYTDQQKLIQTAPSDSVIQSTVTLPNNLLNMNNSDSYKYMCKYLDSNSKLWTNDTSICHTETVTIGASNQTVVVQCQCSQPGSVSVSLDYIQFTESVDEGNIGAGETETCSNPCGCSSYTSTNSEKKGMKKYGIALIVVACSLVVIVLIILAITSAIMLVMFKKGKGTPEVKTTSRKATDEIEQRFDTMYN